MFPLFSGFVVKLLIAGLIFTFATVDPVRVFREGARQNVILLHATCWAYAFLSNFFLILFHTAVEGMFPESCETSMLGFFLNTAKDTISVTEKIFAKPQICDWSFPSSRNSSFSKAHLSDWKWKSILKLLKIRNNSNCILIFDSLYNCRESIDINAEPDITLPSLTICEPFYKTICMMTILVVITHGLRWTLVTCFIRRTGTVSAFGTGCREWEYLVTLKDLSLLSQVSVVPSQVKPVYGL